MKSCVVVGGGISGLTAAMLLKKHFTEVILIEQGEHLGGLLSSVTDSAGNRYDQGTHIPEKTGNPEIDDILFDKQELANNWHALSPLVTGNYFRGQWDNSTQTIDARKLPNALYHQGIGEFMSLTESPNSKSIATYLTSTLGEIFYHHLAKPVIEKLYGDNVDCNDLAVKTGVNYFGAGRIKAFDPETTRTLKSMPAFDSKLGFHSASEYEALLKSQNLPMAEYFYPKGQLGAQTWIDSLTQRALEMGVSIRYQSQITEIKSRDKRICEVVINGGESQPCELVYWSAPPVFALKAANLTIPSAPVQFRTANVLHYTFDKKPNNDIAHYVWNWDASSPIFRITLYHNIRQNDVYQITAEVLSSKEQADSVTLEKGEADLKSMGLIDEKAQVLSSLKQTIHNTFPVPTHAFSDATKAQCDTLNAAFDNFILSGRFSGRCWLQSDVLKLAHQEIMDFCQHD